MTKPGDRVDVVLEAEWLPDGDTRIHVLGVFPNGTIKPPQQYDQRNVVETWFDTTHDVRAFRIPFGGKA